MPVAFRFVAQYLCRQPFRVTVSILGVALAFATLSFIYGIGGTLVNRSTQALALAVGGADYWAVPSSGVQVEPETGLLIGRGTLTSQQIEALQNVDASAQVTPVLVQTYKTSGLGTVIVYGIGDPNMETILVSMDVWAKLGGQPGKTVINGQEIEVATVDRKFPPHSIVLPITIAWKIGGIPTQVSWLWIKTQEFSRWQQVATSPFVIVATPLFVPQKTKDVPLLYAVTHAASRFNPFSFDTQFASLVLSRTISTMLGRAALVVVLLSLVMSLTSTLLGLEEKRDVIAVLSVHGNVGETLFVSFVEASLIHVVGFILGTTVGILALHQWVINVWNWSVIGTSLVMPLLYLPLFVICCTLVAGQMILGQSTATHLKKYV